MASGVAASGPEPTYPESRVLIIITGGTICMQPSASGLVPVNGFLENAMAPRVSFNDQSERMPLTAIREGGEKVTLPSLRTPVTAYSRHVRYGALEFNPLLDSSSISSDGWAQIANCVKDNYHLFDGFVVLHGTDSLSYSASALSFIMEDLGKPVILTGSQASIFTLQSDAVDNLLGSLIIAGTFVIPEVCLFFHHTLFRGNRTTKVSASAFEAFASPNLAPLAKVTGLGVDVNWSLVRRPTKIARFAVRPNLDTAHVASVRIFPGIKPEMVDSVLRVPDLRGLILETFGMGNAPSGVDGSLTRVIADAVDRGITIVSVSQCTSGFVSPLYAPAFALGRAGVVSGLDLTSEAALTKLSCLLAQQELSPADVAEKMGRNLKGEMTELAQPSFTHPAEERRRRRRSSSRQHPRGGHHGTKPQDDDDDDINDVTKSLSRLLAVPDVAFTVLGYAIARGDIDAVRDLLDDDEDSYHPLSSSVAQQHQLQQQQSYKESGTPVAGVDGPAAELSSLLKRADYAGNTAMHLAAIAGPSLSHPSPSPAAAADASSSSSAIPIPIPTSSTTTSRGAGAAVGGGGGKQSANLEIMKELLTRGASVHARNRADHTPLYLALKRSGGREDDGIVMLLREAGAGLWGQEDGGSLRA